MHEPVVIFDELVRHAIDAFRMIPEFAARAREAVTFAFTLVVAFRANAFFVLSTFGQ